MNIAFVSSGRSIHVKKLANGLIEHGHSVTLFTLPDHTKLLDEFNSEVKIVILKYGGKLGYYLNIPFLRKKLLGGGFDIINCHYISGYGTLTRLANVHPIVTSVFGSDVYKYPYKSNSNMKRIIKNLDSAEVITSTSQVMSDKVREYYISNKPIYVTHFGVDLSVFKPVESKKGKSENQCFTFGIVKKLEDIYGIELLIKAYEKFLEGVEDKSRCRLMIYGTGSKEEKYKELVKKLELQDFVSFEGFINNELVPEALSKIDVVCMPSYSESFGVAAVEAMACAKPLIVSDASGFTEVVEDKSCGFITPSGDLNALVQKMRECYKMDSEALTSMGLKGLKRARKYFNFDNNIKTYIRAISLALKDER